MTVVSLAALGVWWCCGVCGEVCCEGRAVSHGGGGTSSKEGVRGRVQEGCVRVGKGGGRGRGILRLDVVREWELRGGHVARECRG
eukprot:4527739-Pleurochrysis_carterae.AAC.2